MTFNRVVKLSTLVITTVLFTACASTPKSVSTTIDKTPASEAIDYDALNGSEAEIIVDTSPVVPFDSGNQSGDLNNQSSYGQGLNGEGLNGGANYGSVDDFVQNAGDRIFFGYNQYSLTNEARGVLRNQAQWLNNFPQVIAVVGGHADERGTREYNLALGARRADAVKDFLISQGVDPSRLSTVSYGKERPIDGSSNEQAWALNRNGHTAIVSGANS